MKKEEKGFRPQHSVHISSAPTRESAMSDDELRGRVAELCGWKKAPGLVDPARLVWVHPNGTYAGHLDGLNALPNYPSDLNACHEMEKVLTYPQQVDYLQLLRRQTKGREMFATAAQRCEAFVKTMSPVRPANHD